MSNEQDLVQARLELRLLGEEAVRYSEQVNARISEILSRFEPSEFFGRDAHIGRILTDVPGIEELDSFEEQARQLTGGPFRLLPSQERAYMAQVRCAIADAVAAARRGQYRQAVAERRLVGASAAANRETAGQAWSLIELHRRNQARMSNQGL